MVKFGDALLECAHLRLVSACRSGLFEAAVDVAQTLVHVGKRAQVRPLCDARRKLFNGGPQRLHVALACSTRLHVLEAAGKACDVAVQLGDFGGEDRRRVGRRGLGFLERGQHARFDLAQFAAHRGDGGGLRLVGHLLGIAAHALDPLGHQAFGTLDAVHHVGQPRLEAGQHRRGAQDVLAAGQAGAALGDVGQPVLHRLQRIAGALFAHLDVLDDRADGGFECWIAWHVLRALEAAGPAKLADLAAEQGEALVHCGKCLDGLALVLVDALDDAFELLAVGCAAALLGWWRNRLTLALREVGQLLGDVLQAKRAVIPTLCGCGPLRGSGAHVRSGGLRRQRRGGHEVFPWVRISLTTDHMRALVENHAI